ncbi:NifU family protein [Natronorubrum texcoconense]|uniref:Fe-S cluster biogenesis protein NfuA, 4Fe-4S-binding domain n=1 Tax=Natronorubrum texcoconense TaxID=1095776 RepID=A0A1G8THV5_9EURY|nr:NifU family protein [Natronorubrum texcoconense]SDJ40250.1 Fe-S cluster biogenesis protein NfuA, 4Fe-4S-binding domain [Natronorubrum texcoconense]
MTTPDAAADAETDGEPPLKERVESWLTREMPIIQMHGGTSAVREADPETGEVIIELGGGCEGCSVSGITSSNIEAELLTWPEIDEITVRVPDPRESLGGPDQAESIMGVDRTEGGRGDWGSSNPGKDHL